MRWFPALLMSWLFVSAALPARADPPALLANGDFAAGQAHWSLPPGAAIEPTGYNGQPALRIQLTKTGWVYATQSVPLDAQQISSVHVAAAMRWSNVVLAPNPKKGAILLLTFFDAKGKQVGGFPHLGSFSGTQDWTPEEMDVPVPEGTVQAKVSLGLENCTGTVWFADVRLTPPNSPGLGLVTADTWVGTSLEGGYLFKVDRPSMTVTKVWPAPFGPDDILFDTAGGLVYSCPTTNGILHSSGQVRRFDPLTYTDTSLASGLDLPLDLVLEPGGHSLLVSEFFGGRIDRIDLATHAVTVLARPGGTPDGLTYDDRGRLFANLGLRDTFQSAFVAQLDPVTGATLAVSPKANALDGLAFDPFSRKLYATSLGSNTLYAIDPNNLSSITTLTTGPGGFDGISSDGRGNLFICGRGDHSIYQYHIPTGTLTQPGVIIGGIDCLAPMSWLGAPPLPVITGYAATNPRGAPVFGAPPGAPVLIEGSNFGSGGSVSFNGIAATTASWSPTEILAIIPHAPSYPLQGPVTVAVNGFTGSGLPFTITAP